MARELYVTPDFVCSWDGKAFVIMRDGNRALKVPAHIRSWQVSDTGSIHLIISQLDVADAEPFYGFVPEGSESAVANPVDPRSTS